MNTRKMFVRDVADKSFKIGVLVFVLFILLSVVAAVLISRVIVQ